MSPAICEDKRDLLPTLLKNSPSRTLLKLPFVIRIVVSVQSVQCKSGTHVSLAFILMKTYGREYGATGFNFAPLQTGLTNLFLIFEVGPTITFFCEEREIQHTIVTPWVVQTVIYLYVARDLLEKHRADNDRSGQCRCHYKQDKDYVLSQFNSSKTLLIIMKYE